MSQSATMSASAAIPSSPRAASKTPIDVCPKSPSTRRRHQHKSSSNTTDHRPSSSPIAKASSSKDARRSSGGGQHQECPKSPRRRSDGGTEDAQRRRSSGGKGGVSSSSAAAAAAAKADADDPKRRTSSSGATTPSGGVQKRRSSGNVPAEDGQKRRSSNGNVPAEDGQKRRSSSGAAPAASAAEDDPKQRRRSGGGGGAGTTGVADDGKNRRRSSGAAAAASAAASAEQDGGRKARRSSGGASGNTTTDAGQRRRSSGGTGAGAAGGGEGTAVVAAPPVVDDHDLKKQRKSSRQSASGGDGNPTSPNAKSKSSPTKQRQSNTRSRSKDAVAADDVELKSRASMKSSRTKSPASKQRVNDQHPGLCPMTPKSRMTYDDDYDDEDGDSDDHECDGSPVPGRMRKEQKQQEEECGRIVRAGAWLIHTDTAGGHEYNRLNLIKGMELDDHEYDDITDLASEPGPIKSTKDKDKRHSSSRQHRSKSPAKSPSKNSSSKNDNPTNGKVGREYIGDHAVVTETTAANSATAAASSRSPGSNVALRNSRGSRLSIGDTGHSSSTAPPQKPRRQKSEASNAGMAANAAKVASLLSSPASPRKPKTKMDAMIQNLLHEEVELEKSAKFDVQQSHHDSTADDENKKEDGGSHPSIGDETLDDTLDNSGHLPMTKLNQELYQSTTWDNPNDFSSDGEGDHDEEIFSTTGSRCSRVVKVVERKPHGHEVRGGHDNEGVGDGDEADDYEEDDDQGPRYMQNTNYSSTPNPRARASAAPKTSSSKQQKKEEQGGGWDEDIDDDDDDRSIDPTQNFLPYAPNEGGTIPPGSSAASSAFPEDSLADIEDSFACDGGGIDYPKPQSLAAAAAAGPPTNPSRSIGSIPGSLNQSAENLRGTAHTAPSSSKRASNISSVVGTSPGQEHGECVETVSEAGKRDVPRLSALRRTKSSSGDECLRGAGGGVRRGGTKRTQSMHSAAARSDAVRKDVANVFAETFLSPGRGSPTDKKHSSKVLGKDLNHQSQSSLESESSSSTMSYGLNAMQMPECLRHGSLSTALNAAPDASGDSTPFMQFDLSVADGIQLKTNEEVETLAEELEAEEESKFEEGQSVDEYKGNDLPDSQAGGMLDAPASPRRQMPSRREMMMMEKEAPPDKISSIRNIRLGVSAAFKGRKGLNKSEADDDAGGGANKSFRKTPVRTASKSDNEIVKRFFSFANSSFGSLASSAGDLLEDDDDDDDMIFE